VKGTNERDAHSPWHCDHGGPHPTALSHMGWWPCILCSEQLAGFDPLCLILSASPCPAHVVVACFVSPGEHPAFVLQEKYVFIGTHIPALKIARNVISVPGTPVGHDASD